MAANWEHGNLKALPLLPGRNNSMALGLNDHGQVIGFADSDAYDRTAPPRPAFHAFHPRATTMSDEDRDP